MRMKSVQRLEAERLRSEEGLSYNEIAERTGLSKSTLSHWLRDMPVKPELAARLMERLQANRASFAERAWGVNKARYARARASAYAEGEQVAQGVPNEPAIHELALAMLYLGEGSKAGNRVQLASTDADIMRFYVCALVDLYGVLPARLTYRLNLVEAARPTEDLLKQWWSDQLACLPCDFMKSQYDPRSKATIITGDYHGVCTVTCHDTYLQERLAGVAHAYLQSRLTQVSVKNKATT
jgi:transcriptional regulator with XRE-family HTH domain